MNIISNAVKYNKEKGEILLSYYETQVDDRHILFEFHCKDTGVGMSKEFQNHIFEPFTQETGGARSVYGGTGLGMPITKKLIERMGGTIKFELLGVAFSLLHKYIDLNEKLNSSCGLSQ